MEPGTPGIQKNLPDFIRAAQARWAAEQRIYKARRTRKAHSKFAKKQAKLNNGGK